jgi:hypothetical protein
LCFLPCCYLQGWRKPYIFKKGHLSQPVQASIWEFCLPTNLLEIVCIIKLISVFLNDEKIQWCEVFVILGS